MIVPTRLALRFGHPVVLIITNGRKGLSALLPEGKAKYSWHYYLHCFDHVV